MYRRYRLLRDEVSVASWLASAITLMPRLRLFGKRPMCGARLSVESLRSNEIRVRRRSTLAKQRYWAALQAVALPCAASMQSR
jgi:hypothetical protein